MNNDDFEWDEKKATRNDAKHGISFEVAREVFDDPARIERADDRDSDEVRFNVTGQVKGRILVVTYTVRGTKIRLISARLAEPFERRRYHEKKR
jgi:uncharacterized protein